MGQISASNFLDFNASNKIVNQGNLTISNIGGSPASWMRFVAGAEFKNGSNNLTSNAINIEVNNSNGLFSSTSNISSTTLLSIKAGDITLGANVNLSSTGVIIKANEALLFGNNSHIIGSNYVDLSVGTINATGLKELLNSGGVINTQSAFVTITKADNTLTFNDALNFSGDLVLKNTGTITNYSTISANNSSLASTSDSIINGRYDAQNPGGRLINASQALILNAKNDIINTASDIISGGDMQITTDHLLLRRTAAEITSETYTKVAHGWFGSCAFSGCDHTWHSYEGSTSDAAKINSGGDLQLNVIDTEIFASDIFADKNIFVLVKIIPKRFGSI